MKGIVHFSVGVAVASCFPTAVEAGTAGNPLYFILGGVFGLLPDTMDFKFYRFFYKHDIEVIPDPKKPDSGMIAQAVAYAVNKAYATGQPVRIKLDTIRMGTDLWQQYEVRFDVAERRVCARYGPVVDTGRIPARDAPKEGKLLEACAPLLCDIRLDYLATTTIDIFDGPLFEMVRDKTGTVTPRFIPWHRQWSHSFVVGLIPALISGLIWRPVAGIVVFLAYAAHILLDQLGFMGSNLFFPFQSRRSEGLKRIHSDRMPPNFLAVWISCLAVFWNLYRAMPEKIPYLNPMKLFFYGLIIPLGLCLLARSAKSNEPWAPQGGKRS